MRKAIHKRSMPLYNILAFHMGWIDKDADPEIIPTQIRLHGNIVLWIASIFRQLANEDIALSYGASAELLSRFFEIHEDVQLGNTERNNRPSVWWVWGPAQAINAGDAMHALARLHLYESDKNASRVSKAVTIFDDAALERCEAEYTDTVYQESFLTSTAMYTSLVESKIGSLIGAAASLGVIAGGGTDACVSVMNSFGRKIGAARQLLDDAAALWNRSDGTPPDISRLITKKPNLPVVFTLTSAPPKLKRKIGEIYMARILDSKAIDEIASITEEAGARQFTEETSHRLAQEANELLETSELNEEAVNLIKPAGDWILNRRE